MGRYWTIDHTADAGIEVEAESLADFFQTAGEAFCDFICDRSTVQKKVEPRIRVAGKSREELLQAFLSELLYRFDVDHELFSEVTIVGMGDASLTALVGGELLDRSRHEIKIGIKAVTFHLLKVWQEGKVWKWRIIFDV